MTVDQHGVTLATGPDVTREQILAWRRYRDYLGDWDDALDEYWRRIADEAEREYFEERRRT